MIELRPDAAARVPFGARRGCPTPWKLYSRSPEGLARYTSDRLDAYLCRCGKWHLTSQKPNVP